MIFDANGKRYRISFAHHVLQGTPQLVGTAAGLRSTRGWTQCFLVELPPSTPGGPKVDGIKIGEGKARCAAADHYNKEQGRRLALRRALESAWPDREQHQIWGLAFQAYSNRRPQATRKK